MYDRCVSARTLAPSRPSHGVTLAPAAGKCSRPSGIAGRAEREGTATDNEVEEEVLAYAEG